MRQPEDFQAEIDAINLLASRIRPVAKPSRPVIIAYTPNGPCMGEHIRRFYNQSETDCIGTVIDTRA
jgi:hypothetical protein